MLTEELTTAMLRVGGPLGIVIVGLVIAVVGLWKNNKRERDKCEQEKAADAKSNAAQFLLLTEKAVAALTMSANAMAANTQGAAELLKSFDRLSDELRRRPGR